MSLVVFLLLVGSALGNTPTSSQSQPFKVVVHPDNPVTNISRQRLSQIFLKQIDQWEDGERTTPVNRDLESRVREAFSRAIHRRSAARINSYWQQQIYSGAGVPPSQRGSDEELLEFVRSNRGAVGYVSAGSDARGVKVVSVIES